MSLSITPISFHDGYVDVILEGQVVGYSYDFLDVNTAAFAAAEGHNCFRILFDFSRIGYKPNIALEDEAAKDLVYKCRDGCRIAVIAADGLQPIDTHFELVVHSRNMDVQVFTNREEAVAWLLH